MGECGICIIGLGGIDAPEHSIIYCNLLLGSEDTSYLLFTMGGDWGRTVPSKFEVQEDHASVPQYFENYGYWM